MPAPFTGGCYLFLGPDRSGKLQRAHQLEEALQIHPLDRHRLDAAVTTAAELLALCRQQPAASAVRLIVVEQAHRFDHACIEALLQHATRIQQTACLILFVETELSVRHALAQRQHAFVVERFQGQPAAVSKPFALTDALGRGNAIDALQAVHEQVMEGKDVFELFGLIAWQLQRWAIVKRLLNAGASMERIASVTGLRAWHIERLRDEVMRRSSASLDRSLSRCWKTQWDAKSGRAVPDLALEQLVLEICRG